MQGLARLLLSRGHRVSGSDMQDFGSRPEMEKMGIQVTVGHRADNIDETVDEVIYSVAIPSTNPEIMEAKKRNLPILRRLELVGEIMRNKIGVAVSGTHGKTTTTKMLDLILTEAKLDPTVLIGAEVKKLSANLTIGQGDIMVVEGCEYGRSFLDLKPKIAVITNIEADHLDYYKDIEDIKSAFTQFAKLVPHKAGLIVANGDDTNVRDALCGIGRKIVWAGVGDSNDIRATDLKFEDGRLYFCISGERMHLHVPGRHHVSDAVLAWATAKELGVDDKTIIKGLHKFRGVERRFELLGETNGVSFIDDYAHHPTEISATLEGMKQYFKGRRLLVVFHPHQFCRTRLLLNSFAQSFKDADLVVVAPIYAVRDSKKDRESISAQDLVDEINKVSSNARFVGDFEKIKELMLTEIKPGDVVVTLGAGQANVFGKELFDEMNSPTTS